MTERTLVDGRKVPESDMTVLTIRTRCAAKWLMVDMETGDVWNHDYKSASTEDLVAMAVIAATGVAAARAKPRTDTPTGRWVPVKERKPTKCDCDHGVWVAEKITRGYRVSLVVYGPADWPGSITHWWDGPDPWVGVPTDRTE